jgi:hypothetical protein
MRIRIELAVRGTVDIEITEEQKKRIFDEADFAMSLDDFERTTGIYVDTSKFFDEAAMKVVDVEFLSEPTARSHEHEPL